MTESNTTDRSKLDTWIRESMNRLDDGLYSQGETPEKYFSSKESSSSKGE